jgi:hypothetical protein
VSLPRFCSSFFFFLLHFLLRVLFLSHMFFIVHNFLSLCSLLHSRLLRAHYPDDIVSSVCKSISITTSVSTSLYGTSSVKWLHLLCSYLSLICSLSLVAIFLDILTCCNLIYVFSYAAYASATTVQRSCSTLDISISTVPLPGTLYMTYKGM